MAKFCFLLIGIVLFLGGIFTLDAVNPNNMKFLTTVSFLLILGGVSIFGIALTHKISFSKN